MMKRTCSAILVFAMCVSCAATASAGGGPENVVLVVNSNSWASQAIANHYIALRDIPMSNLVYLPWEDSVDGIDAETFRQKILLPVFQQIDARGLSDQIDYVVYSADFPYYVNVAADFEGQKLPPYSTPTCSLTGATYLWQFLTAKNPALLALHSNLYMRGAEGRTPAEPTRGFRGQYGWGPNGELLESGGQHYLLSTMLAYTSGRGNSVSEAIDYLRRAAQADGTSPSGSVYYAKTDDVRTTTRAPAFAAAVEELKQLGVSADVIREALPRGKRDVIGLMTGVAQFDWRSSKSTMAPGAICENLTSFGGMLAEDAGQTPFTELLRYGAAGSSGTVTEPYALQDKFPHPLLFVHYARGCTLAESFYQSVYGPFQLLIVGDPLCRPWAKIPEISATGIKANDKLTGKVSIKPSAKMSGASQIAHFELFVDGRRIQRIKPDESFEFDTATQPDGSHELRIVGVEDAPIETQGRLIVPVTFANHGRSIQFAASPGKIARWDQKLAVAANAPGMKAISIYQNGRRVGLIKGEKGKLQLDARAFGSGPITLQAVAALGDGATQRVVAQPIDLAVQTAMPLQALAAPVADPLVRGLQLTLADGKKVPIQETRSHDWLSKAGVGKDESFQLDSYFNVPSTDAYQFQVWHRGELNLSVDGAPLYKQDKGQWKQHFVPVALAKGLHRLSITGKTADPPELRLLFGGPGATTLDGKRFRHAG